MRKVPYVGLGAGFLGCLVVGLSGCGKLNTDPGALSIQDQWKYDAPADDYCTSDQLFGDGGGVSACLISGRVTRFSDGSAWYSVTVSFAGSGTNPTQVFSDFVSAEGSVRRLHTVADTPSVFSLQFDPAADPRFTLNFADTEAALDATLAKTIAFVRQ